jgi:pimeloyl-ACP methyl ester carboxylesterase
VACLAYAGVAVGEALGQGLSGHDYTGLLLLPAGIALLVLAGTTLWRSRRTGASRARRYVRRALLGVVALLLAFFVAVPLAFAIASTHRPRVEVEAADLGRPYEEVTLATADGLDLAARYVPSENGAAVIVFPGRGSRAPQARMLAEAGYGVLMLDMRGQGESEGMPNAFGWGSTKDLDAAIAYLEARPDVKTGRIGGIGFSVGGELMIEAAAGNDGLAAVVSEGAGERSWREGTLRGAAGWPATANLFVTDAILTTIGGEPAPPALQDLVGDISPRPLFLIYATNGQGGEDLNPEYFEAAGEPKELWEITTGGHTGGFEAEPEEYRRRVLGFFEEALGR